MSEPTEREKQIADWRRRLAICIRNGMVSPVDPKETLWLLDEVARLKGEVERLTRVTESQAETIARNFHDYAEQVKAAESRAAKAEADKVDIWTCHDCGFQYPWSLMRDWSGRGHGCPACAIKAAEGQVRTLREAARAYLAAVMTFFGVLGPKVSRAEQEAAKVAVTTADDTLRAMIGHPDSCEHGARLKNYCSQCAVLATPSPAPVPVETVGGRPCSYSGCPCRSAPAPEAAQETTGPREKMGTSGYLIVQASPAKEER